MRMIMRLNMMPMKLNLITPWKTPFMVERLNHR